MSHVPSSKQLKRFARRKKILLRRVWNRLYIFVRSIIYRRPTTIVLIRHGESARNIIKPPGVLFFTEEHAERRKEIAGLADRSIPLTDRGIAQALATGSLLKNRDLMPHTVFCSPYERTRKTKDHILRAWKSDERKDIRVVYSDSLRERTVGYTWDMTEDEVNDHFPFYLEYLQKYGGYDSAPPGGESLAQVSDRIEQFILKYFPETAGNTIYIITHGDPYATFRSKFEHWDPVHWPEIEESPKHCGITIYEYDLLRNRYKLKEYNTVAWKEGSTFG